MLICENRLEFVYDMFVFLLIWVIFDIVGWEEDIFVYVWLLGYNLDLFVYCGVIKSWYLL